MSRETHGAPTGRCLAVWLLTTVTIAAVLLALRPELAAAARLTDPVGRAGARFDVLLAAVAAVALAACSVWFWVVTTVAVVQALTGRLRSVRGCPDGVRRALLVACGLALAASATAPAVADSTAGRPPAPDAGHTVTGLPLPDRVATAPPASHPSAVERPPVPTDEVHVVTVGETLWAIAARSLPNAASDAAIDQRWREIWAANRRAVGPDPDLIHPGATVHLPPVKES
jgi:hypothetical protein